MKKIITLTSLFIGFSFSLSGFAAPAPASSPDLVVFPAPAGIEPSKDYKITVNGKPVFCYASWRLDNIHKTNKINGRSVSRVNYAIFDFSSPVRVRLELRQGILDPRKKVRVLPSALNISPEVHGNVIEFTLNAPGNVTIDPTGDSQNALHLFTNLPETDVPSPDDPNVVYFGPGVHDVESVNLKSGQTLYVAGGAVLRLSPPPRKQSSIEDARATAAVQAEDQTGVTIRGRGVISGSRAFDEKKRFRMIRCSATKNVTIRDVVVTDTSSWTVTFDDCTNVLADGLRVVCFYENSDGVVVSGCSDVVVRNCFVHNADDGLGVKAWKPVKNVLFENCQVWSDSGTPMGLTGEIFAPVENAAWRKITVIHYPSFPASRPEMRAAILIRARNGGRVRDIVFEDILVESNIGRRMAVRITNEKVNWANEPQEKDLATPYSEISNVTLRNVVMRNFSNPKLNNRMIFKNDSDPALMHDIVLDNVVIDGKRVTAGDSRIENKNCGLVIRQTARQTAVTTKGESFCINGAVTFKGKTWRGYSIEGLLPNSRMINGIFDDANPDTRHLWAYPDTKTWDPERNTREFVENMPLWKKNGLLAFTIGLQGGTPVRKPAAQPWKNSALDEKGELKPEYMNRLATILDKADELGMVVILGIYYVAQEKYMKDEAAVLNGIRNTVEWVVKKGYSNVIIEINNECNNRYTHPILRPDRVHEAILYAKKLEVDGRRLMVGTSYLGGRLPSPEVVKASDFILLHGNAVKEPRRIVEMANQVRQMEGYAPKPVLFNEDDTFDFDKPMNNFVAATSAGASWGFFDYRNADEPYEVGFQCVPVDWGINSARKKEFFNLLKQWGQPPQPR